MRPCAIDGCPKPTGVPGTARGWCSTHYSLWQKTGNPLLTASSLKPPTPADCAVDGCDGPRWARGWCATHYQRWRTRGEVGGAELLAKPAMGRCSVPKCRRPVRSKELCQRHYLRKYRHGDPLLGATDVGVQEQCSVRDCHRDFYALGLCHAHWSVNGNKGNREVRLGQEIPGLCTPKQLIARIDYYGNRCWMCKAPADQVDHVKPLSAGGSAWPSNLRPACRQCNSAKSSRWPFPVATSAREAAA